MEWHAADYIGVARFIQIEHLLASALSTYVPR
jgi:hypothetical protein